MAGQIQNTIQKIIDQKSAGNRVIASSVRTKMILKGVSVDSYTPASPDDPEIMVKLGEIAAEFGVTI